MRKSRKAVLKDIGLYVLSVLILPVTLTGFLYLFITAKEDTGDTREDHENKSEHGEPFDL